MGGTGAYLDQNATVTLNGQLYGCTIRSATCELLCANARHVCLTEIHFVQRTIAGKVAELPHDQNILQLQAGSTTDISLLLKSRSATMT